MSWKVFVIIFLIFAILGIWIQKTPPLELVLLNTFTFVILYHLFITLPSVILHNIENKYLKIFIHFLVLIVLFSIVIVYIAIPMYEGMQKEEEKFRKMNQSVQQDIREEKTPSNDVISLAWNQCGGQLWKVQISITPIDSYQVVITKYACTKGGEYIDGQFYEDGKLSKPTPGLEGYSYSGQIIDSNDNIVVDFIGGGDELSVVETPEGFPLLTILSSFYGASNNSHTYLLYSTSPVLKKVGEITQPLNEYQVTNGNGSEREVDGFYQDSDGNFLIDRLTTEGTELGKCNACQEWRLETLKLVNGNMVSIGIRDYDFNNYQRLE
jgi:hypothetical protein